MIYGAVPAAHLDSCVATPHTWHAAEMFLYLVEAAGGATGRGSLP